MIALEQDEDGILNTPDKEICGQKAVFSRILIAALTNLSSLHTHICNRFEVSTFTNPDSNSLAFRTLPPLILCLLISQSVKAAEFPVRANLRINDYANVVNADTTTRITNMLDEIETKIGIDASVVTIKSLDSYTSSANSLESFATSLFNSWGLGDARTNLGVLILVSVGDNKTRIEVGKGFGSRHNSALGDIIQTKMLPSFRQADYDTGLKEGTGLAIIELSVSAKPTRSKKQGNPWPMILAGRGALGVAGLSHYVLGKWRRYKTRYCEECKAGMHRLGPDGGLEYLSDGERAEQTQESIIYDVWKCGSCNHILKVPYPKKNSRITLCPSCNYRTQSKKEELTVKPTRLQYGQKKVDSSCANCGYSASDLVLIPILASSASGGGDGEGSGGGSSSGGGASGGE